MCTSLFLCNRKDLVTLMCESPFLLHKRSAKEAHARNEEFHRKAVLRRHAKWDAPKKD